MKNFIEEYLQKKYEKALYDSIEESVKSDDLNKLKDLTQQANNIDFEHDEGHLGILASAQSAELLNYIVGQCPSLLNNYGLEMLKAAVWASNTDTVSFLINEKGVDYHALEGLNVYDFCLKTIGSNDEGIV